MDQRGRIAWERTEIVRNRGKLILTLVIAAAILVLAGSYGLLDWGRLYENGNFQLGKALAYRNYAKLAVVFLCAGLAFLAGKDSVSSRDRRLMCTAFPLMMVADYLFVLGTLESDPSYTRNGVYVFCVVQLVLITRFFGGARRAWAMGRLKPHQTSIAAIGVVLLVGLAGFAKYMGSGLKLGDNYNLLLGYTALITLALYGAIISRWVWQLAAAHLPAGRGGHGAFSRLRHHCYRWHRF